MIHTSQWHFGEQLITRVRQSCFARDHRRQKIITSQTCDVNITHDPSRHGRSGKIMFDDFIEKSALPSPVLTDKHAGISTTGNLWIKRKTSRLKEKTAPQTFQCVVMQQGQQSSKYMYILVTNCDRNTHITNVGYFFSWPLMITAVVFLVDDDCRPADRLYHCTGHVHRAVMLSQRRSKKKKIPTEIEKQTGGGGWGAGGSVNVASARLRTDEFWGVCERPIT